MTNAEKLTLVRIVDALERLDSFVERMASVHPGRSHNITMGEFGTLRRDIDYIKRSLEVL